MLRLLKYLVILKLLNPFQRGFSLIRLLGCVAVVGGLLYYYGMPGWLEPMLEQALGGKQTQTAQNGGIFGGGQQSSGGVLSEMLGEGEKAVGGILDNILNKNKTPASEPPRSDGGLLGNIFGSGGKSAQQHYGPPADFAGGTVTANPELFAAFARHGATAAQIRSLPDSPMPPTKKPDSVPWQKIQTAVDGDTLTVGGQKVRLIGIDAPEAGDNDHLRRELNRIGGQNEAPAMMYMGREAAEFARRLADGKRCWLEFDGPERDQYGRILAYVHLEDGTNLNEAILYQGYAKAYLNANFRYLKRYIFIQDEAMRRGNGLWKK